MSDRVVQCSKFNLIQALADSSDRWKDVADWQESVHVDIRTDIALYPGDDQAHEAYDIVPSATISEGRKPFVGRNAWAWMKMFLECKPSEAESGYLFSSDTFLNNSPTGQTARAQNIKYASEIMLRQHRKCLFSMYATPTSVAIFRWDRNGTIYTTIDLRKNWKQLFHFIYRFAKLSNEQQGFDPTVTLATTADVEKLRAYHSDNTHLVILRDNLLSDTVHYPLHKVCNK